MQNIKTGTMHMPVTSLDSRFLFFWGVMLHVTGSLVPHVFEKSGTNDQVMWHHFLNKW
jgi:hypothetical protein